MSLKVTIVGQPPVTRASHKLSPVQLSDPLVQAIDLRAIVVTGWQSTITVQTLQARALAGAES